MKKIYTILLCVLGLHLTLQAQWVQITPPNGGDDYTSVVFPTKDTGYAVGMGSPILKTVDGGNNWVLQTQINIPFLWDVCFTDANKGFAVGSENTVYKTTNGGILWSAVTSLSSFNTTQYISVCFPTKNTGYILPSGDTNIYKTIDGGNTWTRLSNLMYRASANGAIYFTDSVTGYVASSGIIKTIDGGNSWVLQDSSGYYNNEYFTSICFGAPDTGYAVTYHGSIYKTINGGNNWVKQVTGTSPNTSLYSVFFTSANVGYAAGGDAINGTPGRILKTTDGGANWVLQTTPSNSVDQLFSLFFTGPDTLLLLKE